VWLQAEGDRIEGSTHESRLELGWDRIVSTWWSVRASWRHDAGFGPSRDWAGFGVSGLAPGFVEVQAQAYLGESGRAALRLAAERDVLLTQRLVLRPELELNAYTEDDAERGIDAGLSDAQFGLRLRYEIRREIAPYVGLLWSWTDEESSEFSAVAGLRVWF
jgi:copper resistance protein B